MTRFTSTYKREKDQCLQSSSIQNNWRWPDSPQPSCNMIYISTLHWSAKCIFPSQTSLHTFFLKLLFPCPLCPPHFPLILNLKKSNALLKMWPSAILNTWQYQLTLFAKANRSKVSFKPSMNIKSVYLFLSLRCTLHMVHTMNFNDFIKFTYHILSGTMLHFHTVLLASISILFSRQLSKKYKTDYACQWWKMQ